MYKQATTAFMKVTLLLLVMGVVSCQQTGKEKKLSGLLTPQLIQACIDTTLSLDKGLNTGNYMVDADVLGNINKSALQEFVKIHKDVKLARIDSLYRTDLSWLEYRYFSHPVIRFETVTLLENGDILVNMSKVKSSDGAIGASMVFRKDMGRYKCIKSEITWIS